MDRDDFLTITSPTLMPVDATRMTDSARRFFESVKWACMNIDREEKCGNKLRPLCQAYSRALLEKRGLEMSAERLRKYYYRWKKIGDAACVNASLMGKAPEKKTLPPAIIDQFWGIYQDMKDKASMEGAWRALMARLMKGERLNGGLTWRKLHMQLRPSAEVPDHCPWNLHNPPPGWSLSNFTSQQRPSDVSNALALKGMGAAKAVLAKQAGVRMDWGSLRIGECYMIDDHDVDFRCLVEGQMVRLRLIVLIEVRTRRVLAYCVRPRTKDDDGTERSISRRDVQHLLAGWLWNFGVPRDYPCFLHCENAAAAVTTDFEEMLRRVTGGRLQIDRTALYAGVVKMASYKQSGGTPTGKAPIESKFRHFDTELALVRGATGSNYTRKPEEHQGRLNAAKDLVDRARDLPIAERNELADLVQAGAVKFPFPSLWEAHEEIHLAIQRMDARTWHAMEGFLKVQEFRTSPDSHIFYPLNAELAIARPREDREIIQEFLTYPDSLQKRMLAWGRDRVESSAECWVRLAAREPFVSISRNALFELLLDSQVREWPGTGEIRLEIAGETLTFRGRIEANAKAKIRFRYNADAPQAVWAQDLAGRVLGTLERTERVSFHDADAQRSAAEFKATALARALHETRGLELSNPDAIRELQDKANLAALMSAFEGAHARPTPVAAIVSETSDALVSAATQSTQKKTPSQSDAWREISRLRRAAK